MVWLETNDAVDDQYGGLDNQPPLYYYGVERYTSSYSEDTIADQGLTTYEKSMVVDTAKKESNQFQCRGPEDRILHCGGHGANDLGRGHSP